MKVLQILPELNMGGVERGCIDLARELIKRNHQALVVSGGGRLLETLEATGARHIKLAVHKKSPSSILANIPRLIKILREERVDIVHARSRVPAIIAFFACRYVSTATFVTTCHGHYNRGIASRVMGWGKVVIAPSSAVAHHMTEAFGVPRERIKSIPRGVDLKEFRFLKKKTAPPIGKHRPETFTIGVIGRLTPIKGHKYFLQALAKVIRLMPEVRAIIVGEVSSGKERYAEELKMLTRRLSLDRYVEFTATKNVSDILSRLDILVLPTITQEAFGRVLIEAAACGVAVIATRVGGVVDIIEDGKNGILVEPRDVNDLASNIIKLLKDGQLRHSFEAAARKNVEENFSLEQMADKTIRVYEELQKTLKILVIKLSALGDVILSIPAFAALRKDFPQAHIAALVASPFKPILQNCPYINEIITMPLKNKGYKEIWKLSHLLRKLNFDVVIDLQNNRKSHILAYLSACNRRYGYDNGKFSFLLNKKIKEIDTPLSPIKHQARTLHLLGVETVKEQLELWPEDADETWAEEFLKQHRKNSSLPLIGINIGASVNWASKRWSIDKLKLLLDKLSEEGIEVLVTGQKQDKELLGHLRGLCKSDFIEAVGETSIMQLACLVKRCNAYITSDSAPLHIAYAVRTPVIALFGPTEPRRHALLGPRQIIIKKKVDCAPCYKRNCRRHNCMKEIKAEEVFSAVKRLLGVNEGKPREDTVTDNAS